MTKQKGFTLIELLAVIVILAIIALIATPIVLNIIGETKKSATLRSAELYLGAVEQTLVKEMMNGNKIENGSYEITKAGNICLEKENDNTCKKELNIETKGSVPTDGTIQITNGKTNKAEMKIDNEIILQEDEKLTQIKNPIFDKKLTFSYWETFDMDAIDNLDLTKLIEKANYKITITGKDKEPISFEVI